MKKTVALGVGFGVAVIAVVVVISVLGGGFGGSAVPASIGFPGDGEHGRQADGHHMTHNPVVVSPKDAGGARGLGEASPARGRTRPERSPASMNNSTVPDTFSPRSTLRPIPDSYDTGGSNGGFDNGLWPDGRPSVVPRNDGLRPPTPEYPNDGRHSVSEVPVDHLNIYQRPPRQR